ncbi:MAG: hypothetical protein PUB19_01785 [Lachnospiraceae bacterium]|nr:hypothetical protein [Lachnospiraceae bacterium]
MREKMTLWTEKIPVKIQKTLLYAGGILLIVLVYVFVFQSMNLKCQEKQIEVSKGQKEAARYTAMKSKQKENEAETKRMKDEIAALLAQFPADVKEEDAIVHADAIEESLDVSVTNLRFEQKNLMEKGEKSQISLFARPIEYTFLSGYKDMKSMIAEIAESGDMRNVDSITIGYDGETGLLQGTMVTNYYSMEGKEIEYKAPNILGVNIGNDNVFGTAK